MSKVIWRLTATAVWLWLLASFAAPNSYFGLLHSIPFRFILPSVLVLLGIYVLIKRDRSLAWGAVFLGFPIYLLAWPVTLATLLLQGGSSVLSGTAKRSQQVLWSLLPYALTAGATYLALAERPRWLWLVVALALLSAAFVVISLIAWVFQPLPWVAAAFRWAMRLSLWNAHQTPMPTTQVLTALTPKAHENLRSAVKALVTARNTLDKTSATFEQAYRDALIAGAFARKFLMSLAHVGFLFGLIHYVISASSQSLPTYSGLNAAPFSNSWFEYFYYGTMTLVSANSGVTPLTLGARVGAMANALTGVAFLVILVTMFSMVTRDRAREAVNMMTAELHEAVGNLESEIAGALSLAFGIRPLTSDVRAEFQQVERFRVLGDPEVSAFKGILLYQQLLEVLEAARDTTNLAEALSVRGTLAPPDLARFFSEAVNRGAQSTADLMDIVRVIRSTSPPTPGGVS